MLGEKQIINIIIVKPIDSMLRSESKDLNTRREQMVYHLLLI